MPKDDVIKVIDCHHSRGCTDEIIQYETATIISGHGD